jgi:hypothetical protein
VTRRACRHENADHMFRGDIVDEGWPDWPADFKAQCEQLRCLDCHAWLPIGPANDASEAVQVEIRAAEIAADFADVGYRPGCDRFEYCPETRSDELCQLCERHYLTHAIATHATHATGAEESGRSFQLCLGTTEIAPPNSQCRRCGRYGQRCDYWNSALGARGENGNG